MKMLCLIALLFCLTGCGTLGESYRNMQQSNEKMSENIVLMRQVRETVIENSEGVQRSTREIRKFRKVNKDNMEAVTELMEKTHARTLNLLVVLGLLLLLIVPCCVLGFSYFNLPRKR